MQIFKSPPTERANRFNGELSVPAGTIGRGSPGHGRGSQLLDNVLRSIFRLIRRISIKANNRMSTIIARVQLLLVPRETPARAYRDRLGDYRMFHLFTGRFDFRCELWH